MEKEKSEQSSEAEFRVDSWMQSVVPSIPRFFAVICLLLNIVVPGLGTVTGGLVSCFCGRPRLDFRPTRHRCPMALLVVGIGVLQLASVAFFLVGWLWSIIWGFLMVNLSGPEFRKLPPLPCPTPSTAGTRKSVGHQTASRNSIIQVQDSDPPGKKNFARLIAKANSTKESDSSLVADSTTDLRENDPDDEGSAADKPAMAADGAITQNHLATLDTIETDNRSGLDEFLNQSMAYADIERNRFADSPEAYAMGSAADLGANDDLMSSATDKITSAASLGSAIRAHQRSSLPPGDSVASSTANINGDRVSSVTTKHGTLERVGTDSTVSKSEKLSLLEKLSTVESDVGAALPTSDADKPKPSAAIKRGVKGPQASSVKSNVMKSGVPPSSPPKVVDTYSGAQTSTSYPLGKDKLRHEEDMIAEPLTKSADTVTSGVHDKDHPLESVRAEHPPIDRGIASPPGAYANSEPDTSTTKDLTANIEAGGHHMIKSMGHGQTSDAVNSERGTAPSSEGGESSFTRHNLSRVGLPDFASMSLPNFLPVTATKSFLVNCYKSVAGIMHKATNSLNNKQTSESCSDLLAAGSSDIESRPGTESSLDRESRRFKSSVHRIFSGWKRRALKISSVQPPSTLVEESEDVSGLPRPHSPTSGLLSAVDQALRSSTPTIPEAAAPVAAAPPLAPPPSVPKTQGPGQRAAAKTKAPLGQHQQGNHVGPGPAARRQVPHHPTGGAPAGNTNATAGQKGRLASSGTPNPPDSVSHGVSKPPIGQARKQSVAPPAATNNRDPLPLNAGRLQKTSNIAAANRPPAVNALKVKQAPPTRKPRSKQGATYHYNA